jgi:hypothetical protein
MVKLINIFLQLLILNTSGTCKKKIYVGVLTSLWLFPFPIFVSAAQPKEFFLNGLKKLEQQSHKCVELREEYVE